MKKAKVRFKAISNEEIKQRLYDNFMELAVESARAFELMQEEKRKAKAKRKTKTKDK